MNQEQEKIEALSQQLTAADKRVVALERELARVRRGYKSDYLLVCESIKGLRSDAACRAKARRRATGGRRPAVADPRKSVAQIIDELRYIAEWQTVDSERATLRDAADLLEQHRRELADAEQAGFERGRRDALRRDHG